MFVHTMYIYIWLLISIYTHIYVHVCVCMCMYCYVWLPSSLLPPSSILTAPFSFQPPSSLLPASIINLVWYIGALIIYLFLYICALAINPVGYIYMYVYIDHTSSLIAHHFFVCVHWPYIYAYVLFFCCLPSWHQGCLPSVHCTIHMHIMPCDRLVFVELHMHD